MNYQNNLKVSNGQPLNESGEVMPPRPWVIDDDVESLGLLDRLGLKISPPESLLEATKIRRSMNYINSLRHFNIEEFNKIRSLIRYNLIRIKQSNPNQEYVKYSDLLRVN